MRRMDTTPKLVVGTAGHIDHGKSRLVLALTGTDPDRLPEEKARGMTIDLGFAHTQIDGCDIYFVDVPGHERFIRNMVAGATGIDVAVLVVAADDSVMPQTREHAEVLSLLGINRCVAVLTKMDLVDDEWAAAVEDEVRGLLESLAIQPIGCVWTSAETDRGIDDLRQLLARLAQEQSRHADPYRWFCLPIDRAFVIAGRGTVVTGSVAHGGVTRDEELELWPAGQRVRVRDLQTHYDGLDHAAGRRRLALNLAGLSRDEVARGCTLATPGYLEPTRWLDVWVAALRMPGKERRQTLRIRLHISTTEVLAELHLREKPTEDPLRDLFAQIKVAEPIVTTWGRRFILRDESGNRTLGGGCILRPVARPWTAKRPAHLPGLATLRAGSPIERLEEVIRAAEWQPLTDKQLALRAGLPDDQDAAETCRRLTGAGKIRIIEAASLRLRAHNAHLATLSQDLDRRLKTLLKDNPRLPGLPLSQVPGWMPSACPARLRPALADWWVQHGPVALEHDHIVPAGQRQQMSAADQALFDEILRELDEAAFQPPGPAGLRCCTPRNEKRIRQLIDLALTQRKLVRIANDLWLHERRWQELVQLVADAIKKQGGITVADIRTLLNSSRKYVVPIVEALDAAGITRRSGDLRQLGPKAPAQPNQ
jgi:selenocysteine-specific elongation factor